MKFLRNISVMLKRHYEKVLLALALLGFVGAVVFLNEMKSKESDKIALYDTETKRRKPKPVPSIDVSALNAALAHATNPSTLNFSPPHNLFNPVKWQEKPDKTRIKNETGKELGINAVQITKILPLSTTVTFDSQAGSGVNMSITQQASTNRYLQQRLRGYVGTNSASDRIHKESRSFTLRNLRVTPEGPEADIELNDGTKATVTPSKPFTRVDGYHVDLFYPPEKQSFMNKRVGDRFAVAGEDYIIVAITPNEVVVSARSNDRRTTIQKNAAP